MTRQEIIDTYGLGVYQIRLDLAMRFHAGDEYSPEAAFSEADKFVSFMESDEHKELPCS